MNTTHSHEQLTKAIYRTFIGTEQLSAYQICRRIEAALAQIEHEDAFQDYVGGTPEYRAQRGMPNPPPSPPADIYPAPQGWSHVEA